MQSAVQSYPSENPEKLVFRLAAKLRGHRLWDTLLIFVPPLAAAVYSVSYLYRAAWIGPQALGLATLAAAGLAALGIVLRYRPMIPSLTFAARLLDQQVDAKDRFLTLATIQASPDAAALMSRLRLEASGYQNLVELKRDFPYQIKRPFYLSLGGSIIAVVLVHLLLTIAYLTLHPVAGPVRLHELAQKMALIPRLSELAHGLESLAGKLETPDVPQTEKRAMIRQMQQKVEQEKQQQQPKDNRELLGQASSTLQGLEQQAGAGENQQKEQAKGGGGIQSNRPETGQGEGRQSQGSGGESKGDIKAQMNNQLEQGKTAQGDLKNSGKEPGQKNQGDAKGNQPDPNRSDSSPNQQQSAGQKPGGPQEKAGNSKASEQIPQGAPPAQRLYKPGENGREGIKGAGYVTVQLPEQVAADSNGEGTLTKAGPDLRNRSKLPVSNTPLPPHTPDSPGEKQHMPLEYRGIIR